MESTRWEWDPPNQLSQFGLAYSSARQEMAEVEPKRRKLIIDTDPVIGVGTPIRRGLGGISVLKWSPTGDYFLVAKFDGTFYLWETGTCTSEPWSSSNDFVTQGATWDPDGRMVLLAFSESPTLGSIHFASKPPSLVAHLFPVDLPEQL